MAAVKESNMLSAVPKAHEAGRRIGRIEPWITIILSANSHCRRIFPNKEHWDRRDERCTGRRYWSI